MLYNMVKENNLNQYEPIGITDDFMFFAVMIDEQICTRLLQELLPELKIKKVTTKAQSQIKGGREDKAIRLDIQAFDERRADLRHRNAALPGFPAQAEPLLQGFG